MNELALFAGAGGGVLGTCLLGWRTIGYVELDEYRQQILRQRIDDGFIDRAPIFTDVREFIQSGAAREYRGFADVVTAGFPCQPFSRVGKRRGRDDNRNLWPETIRVIRDVRPRFALLENTPGLFDSGYLDRIFGDLAESGYGVRWRRLSARECGAPHKRDRLWVLAYADEIGCYWRTRQLGTAGRAKSPHGDPPSADTQQDGLQGQRTPRTEAGPAYRSSDRAHSRWWATEPDVGRVVNGLAGRVDRIKALGDGQVPVVVARVWELLTHEW